MSTSVDVAGEFILVDDYIYGNGSPSNNKGNYPAVELGCKTCLVVLGGSTINRN